MGLRPPSSRLQAAQVEPSMTNDVLLAIAGATVATNPAEWRNGCLHQPSVTIGLYRGRHARNPFGRLIAWWQRSDFSHCAVVWQRDQDATPGVAYVSEATLLGGVRSHWRKWEPGLWELHEVEADRAAVSRWWTERQGRRYDAVGLLGFIFRRIKGARGAYWCSEAVAESLNLGDPWRWDVALLRVYLLLHGKRTQQEGNA